MRKSLVLIDLVPVEERYQAARIVIANALVGPGSASEILAASARDVGALVEEVKDLRVTLSNALAREEALRSALDYCVGTIENVIPSMDEVYAEETEEVEEELVEIKKLLEPQEEGG